MKGLVQKKNRPVPESSLSAAVDEDGTVDI